ncbi:MAG: hypothetical protein IJ733_13190 [Lachnospiraceae bacterium]|nr:hypothetical protein [Lachnospiraceae bacterium]
MKFVFDKKRIVLCFLAVFGMGFFLSFLILCNLGTDPCTFMNRSLAAKIGISFGNLQLCMNAAMLVFVLIFRRSLLGFGTIFNMVLVGYYADFFDWLWGRWIPGRAFTEPVSRWCIFFVALACFIVSVAIYINSDLGVAPYDALPIIITEKLTNRFPKFPGFLIRIFWDGMAILIGILAGGIPIIGIVLMALFLGPVISYVGKWFEKISIFDYDAKKSSQHR